MAHGGYGRTVGERNWAGNHEYGAAALHRPASLEELRELVATRPRIRVLGSRHSFTDLPDSAELLTLDDLPAAVSVDRAAATVTCSAALRYGDLARALDPEGLALANLASLPHISVGGAIATATHGSGAHNGSLASAVAALELVTSAGEVLELRRGDPDFDGAVVGLGALGAVTRVTLDVEPAYDVRQRVFEDLAWAALLEQLDAIMALGYSTSVFLRWTAPAVSVWVKSRVGAGDELEISIPGARPATVERHPIIGLDPVNCSAQLGVPGPWWDRLPHFRMGFTPSTGDELQSEFLLGRADAVPALEALCALGPAIDPVVQVTELRTVAADPLWMSPQHGRETFAVHFTWVPDEAAVRAALVRVEAALAPFAPRPHWGKVFLARAADLAPGYPRLPDFAALAARLDARGAFRNAWLERHVLG